ncbi:MAG: HK97 family phage prohead protease [Kiloniellales bacterium]
MDELLRALAGKAPEVGAAVLSNWIGRRLATAGATAGAAADALGVSPSAFRAYALGRRAAPPDHRLAKLAVLLSLPPDSFAAARVAIGSNALAVALGAAVLCAVNPGKEAGPKDVGAALAPESILAERRAEEGEPADGEQEEDEREEPEPETTDQPDVIAGEIAGYAAVWDELDSKEATLFRAGAFAETIAASQAALLYWEHAHSMLGKGGSTPIGATFSLTEDSIGLWMRAWIADTTLGRDVAKLMGVIEAAGLEMGASVAGFPIIWRPNFVEPPRAWERGVDAGPGALLSFDLKEISLAGFPALDSARVRLATDDPAAMIAAANDRLARITGG